jgi:hypothetical protein
MIRIIEIKKGDIRKKAVEYKWTASAVEVIKQIAQEWLDTDYAESVLLFFKDAGGELHAYMPITSINNRQSPPVHDIENKKNGSNIIGVEPYSIEDTKFIKEDLDFIVRVMGQEYYWFGNEVFRMSDHGNIQEFEIDTQVKWETIKYGRDRVRAVKERTGKAPAHLVRAIEAMQREYDEQTGFAECQLESHAFAIKLEGLFNKGRFAAKDLLRLIENQFDLFNLVSPGEQKPFTMHLAAFVPGSSCLVGDYDISPDADEQTDKIKVKESIAKAEERMSSIVQAAPVLVDKSKTPAQRVKEFKKATGLSNEEAYAAMHDISKLRGSKQTIKLYTSLPTSKEKTQAEVSIDGSAISQIAEIKRTLATLIEPEDTTTITGKIVELDHYKDEDLKFGIYVEDEARLYTIHYPEKEDKIVRAKKGTVVSLKAIRERVNKPWHFQEWK